jgi:hypothetical protein
VVCCSSGRACCQGEACCATNADCPPGRICSQGCCGFNERNSLGLPPWGAPGRQGVSAARRPPPFLLRMIRVSGGPEAQSRRPPAPYRERRLWHRSEQHCLRRSPLRMAPQTRQERVVNAPMRSNLIKARRVPSRIQLQPAGMSRSGCMLIPVTSTIRLSPPGSATSARSRGRTAACNGAPLGVGVVIHHLLDLGHEGVLVQPVRLLADAIQPRRHRVPQRTPPVSVLTARRSARAASARGGWRARGPLA